MRGFVKHRGPWQWGRKISGTLWSFTACCNAPVTGHPPSLFLVPLVPPLHLHRTNSSLSMKTPFRTQHHELPDSYASFLRLTSAPSNFGLCLPTKTPDVVKDAFPYGGGLSSRCSLVNGMAFCGGPTDDATRYAATTSGVPPLPTSNANPENNPKVGTSWPKKETPRWPNLDGGYRKGLIRLQTV